MKNYTPSPINTNDIILEAELLNLTEEIAKNIHEIWALARKNEGWVYGETKNSETKTTPCLVPYDELPESEKEYDRQTVLGTISLIKKLGYFITRDDPARLNFSLAKSYNDMGDLYKKLNQPEKAGTMYLKSLEIKEQLAENNAELTSYLIHSYNNAGNFFIDQEQSVLAEEMFKRALDICLNSGPGEDSDADLATTYFNYGIFLGDTEYLDKALDIAETRPDNPFCKVITKVYHRIE